MNLSEIVFKLVVQLHHGPNSSVKLFVSVKFCEYIDFLHISTMVTSIKNVVCQIWPQSMKELL